MVVKVLSKNRLGNVEARLRFDREMKAIGRFEHPNIVRAFDAGKLEKTHFIVMEHVDGIDLSRLIDATELLSVAAACELVRQAAVGLQHIHEHRLVHRDIKPSNLMVSRCGVVKILDLGVARSEAQQLSLSGDTVSGHFDETLGDITKTGQFLGTSDFMAPEQWDDTHRVDIRTDLYSLGCTFYNLLVGHVPHDGTQFDTPYKKMRAHMYREPAGILDCRPDVPPGSCRHRSASDCQRTIKTISNTGSRRGSRHSFLERRGTSSNHRDRHLRSKPFVGGQQCSGTGWRGQRLPLAQQRQTQSAAVAADHDGDCHGATGDHIECPSNELAGWTGWVTNPDGDILVESQSGHQDAL